MEHSLRLQEILGLPGSISEGESAVTNKSKRGRNSNRFPLNSDTVTVETDIDEEESVEFEEDTLAVSEQSEEEVDEESEEESPEDSLFAEPPITEVRISILDPLVAPELEFVADASDTDDPELKNAALSMCPCGQFGLHYRRRDNKLICGKCGAVTINNVPQSTRDAVNAHKAQKSKSKATNPTYHLPPKPANGPRHPNVTVSLEKLQTRPDIPVWNTYTLLRKDGASMDEVAAFYREVFDITRVREVLGQWVTIVEED